MILPSFEFEKSLFPVNCRYVLGIDEVGRGPWAGPVTIGAFLLDLKTFNPDTFLKLKVRDSKKLNSQTRQFIHDYFIQRSYSFSTFSSNPSDIDSQGIGVCLKNLINQALSHYRSIFDIALVDGNYSLTQPKVVSVISGDAKCFSIAAASIVAKVVRDQLMDNYDVLYPQYDFKHNKGYGTAAHQLALIKHGVCPIHRLSFKPINKISTAF